jgi:DNA-binding transcriptional LysR family regulator
MSFDRVLYFLTVAKTGSLARAAELHRISSPAMTKAMQVLAGELGIPLFRRDGRGIALTAEGKRFLTRVEPLAREFENVLRHAPSDPEPATAPLRIGTFEVFSTHVLARIMREAFPGRDLLAHELIPGELEEAILNDQVDFGVTYVPIPRNGVEFLKIARIEMAIVARHDRFPVIDLKSTPFAVPVSPVEGSPTRIRGLDGWPEDRLPRIARYKVTMMETAAALVRQGVSVMFLPKFLIPILNETARTEHQIALRQLPARVSAGARAGLGVQNVYLVKRAEKSEDTDVKKFTAALRKILNK